MLANKAIFTKTLVTSMVVSLLFACGSGGSSDVNSAPVAQQTTIESSEISLPITKANTLLDEISPQQAITAMAIGINLGNTLDAPKEGDWALPAKKSL